ncbi:hypothetical protein MMC14_009572, partial [Varicellaria rhodocarpa]|nr:hypothetical protein [Varicellaria rhodocarpa]
KKYTASSIGSGKRDNGATPAKVLKSQSGNSAAYQPIPRPWKDPNAGRTTKARSGTSPMERWQAESIRDQAWNGVAGAYVPDVMTGGNHGKGISVKGSCSGKDTAQSSTRK